MPLDVAKQSVLRACAVCETIYKASMQIKSTPILFLSMSNATIQSIALGIVANNIATAMRMNCCLTGVSTHN